MPAPDSNTEGTDGRIPEDLAEVGVYPSAEAGFDHGLVVLAMGLSYILMPSDNGYKLLVDTPFVSQVRRQLEIFDRESVSWPPSPTRPSTPAQEAELLTPALWALAISVVFARQCAEPEYWENFGAMDAQALFDRGELWRPVTALFLHADFAHLCSNLIFGVIVFSALIPIFGRLRGWLLLLVASAAANLAVAGINYGQPYRSLGASTAVFAGLGLLTGRAIAEMRDSKHPHRFRTVLIPLMSGLSLLAFLGTGGLRTDVAAHASGFASGLALGFVARFFNLAGKADPSASVTQ